MLTNFQENEITKLYNDADVCLFLITVSFIDKRHVIHAEAMTFLFAGTCKIRICLLGVFENGI